SGAWPPLPGPPRPVGGGFGAGALGAVVLGALGLGLLWAGAFAEAGRVRIPPEARFLVLRCFFGLGPATRLISRWAIEFVDELEAADAAPAPTNFAEQPTVGVTT